MAFELFKRNKPQPKVYGNPTTGASAGQTGAQSQDRKETQDIAAVLNTVRFNQSADITGRITQEQIDRLSQAVVKNAVMSASPRFFLRGDGSVNEREFADWTKPIVHVNGNLGTDSIRAIETPGMGNICMTVLESKIQELRETSGTNETSTGGTPSGVTAASAIAALQEASGNKGCTTEGKYSIMLMAVCEPLM